MEGAGVVKQPATGQPHGDPRQCYLDSLHATQWAYRDTVLSHDGHLFRPGEDRQHPPVFLKEHAGRNVLCPPDPELTTLVLDSIPAGRRHRWFRSLKSSQALAQSVFGNLKAHRRLDCLLDVRADDDDAPAFGAGPMDPDGVELEHRVGREFLMEPRPTDIDVWMSGRTVVCVECELTEAEVGQCSRPRCPTHRFPCNGNFEQQPGLQYRCALARQGVQYWSHIPRILKWSHEEDARPCKLLAPYQLVRNILAACVEGGRVNPDRGHALLVFDARNPAFWHRDDGTFEKLQRDLRDPALLRRCSWQSIIRVMADYDDLTWLVRALEQKYGLNPA
jgi:hypothetical protein